MIKNFNCNETQKIWQGQFSRKIPNESIKKLPNIHPGEILKAEFLIPMQITAYRLAKETGIAQTTIRQIIKFKGHITADIALRLSCFFGTTAQFWLGLQNDYDLEEVIKLHTTKKLICLNLKDKS